MFWKWVDYLTFKNIFASFFFFWVLSYIKSFLFPNKKIWKGKHILITGKKNIFFINKIKISKKISRRKFGFRFKFSQIIFRKGC